MAKISPQQTKTLQELLNKFVKPKPPLEVDGIFGPLTQAALKTLQKMATIKDSGDYDADTAQMVTRLLKTGKIETDPPVIFVDIGGGKYAGFTQKEWDKVKANAIADLMRGPVREAKMKAAMAMAEWDHFDDLNRDQYAVSFFIELTRGAKMPPQALMGKAVAMADRLEKLAKAGDFKGFSALAPDAAKTINEALEAMRAYRRTMIDGAGNWVTGLEVTKWVSFTSLSVVFAPVVGASLGASALATAVVGGAAIKGVESAAGEIGNWTAGNLKGEGVGGPISRVVIDAGVGAITGYLAKGGAGGKAMGERAMTLLTEGIAKRLTLSVTSKKVLEAACKYFLNEGAKKAMEGAVQDAAKALKGDPKMTAGAFLISIRDNFLKGCAFGPINQAFKSFSEGKLPPMEPALYKKVEKSIYDRAVKELLKGGRVIDMKKLPETITGQWNKLASDTIGKAMAKSFEKIAVAVFDSLKGAPSEKAVSQAIQDELYTPQLLDQCRDVVADAVIAALEKDAKRGK